MAGTGFVGGIILLAVGILVFRNPAGWYTITEGWKHEEGAQPSESYLSSTKMGAGILIVVAVFMIVASIFVA